MLYEDGSCDTLSLNELRRSDGLAESELVALTLADGNVLDVGCGAGAHLVELRRRHQPDDTNLHVGVDVSLSAGSVARATSHEPVACGRLACLAGERWDTVLLLMNGLGLAGNLRGVLPFLRSLRDLLSPGGQILLESTDLECRPTPEQRKLVDLRRESGRHPGESRQQLVWRDLVGDVFDWIYLSPDDLGALAVEVGLTSQVLYEDGDGTYLARLVAL